MDYFDHATGIRVCDPQHDPFAGTVCTTEALQEALKGYILSASGWRNIYAADKDEESTSLEISTADAYLTGLMALAFADFMAGRRSCALSDLTLLLAADTRPTGPAIADIFNRVLLASGVTVKYSFIAAAPEAMANSAVSFEIDGFIYISASHNPVGYNGVKFGYTGKVIDAGEADELIRAFRTLCTDQEAIDRVRTLSSRTPLDTYEALLESIDGCKAESLDQYRMFTASVASGSMGICSQDQVYNTIRALADREGLGVVIDFNGSARTRSIDRDLLTSMGVSVETVGEDPGVFTHRIVPEGESLNTCRELLEDSYMQDPSYLFGYLPDCDGDRGNIVYMDEAAGKAKILEAQEVFALAVLSELAFITSTAPEGPHAVVVNGPTSMRIDEIAGAFGVRVFRAEVGEANAVTLAQQLRDEGYTVRILGEGSNGGNITHPASVRDPLNTAVSLLKLMAIRDTPEQQGLFSRWCEASGQADRFTPHFSLADVIATLPAYTTTSAYEPRAILRITSTDQEILKQRYEGLFERYWETHTEEFRTRGIFSFEEINTAGTVETRGSGKEARPASSTGGLKILFFDEAGLPAAYIWMRGSKTEPVFRVLADVRGDDPILEEWLLSLHKQLIGEADSAE